MPIPFVVGARRPQIASEIKAGKRISVEIRTTLPEPIET
jgi:hypothetical protein